jgi:DNA-binding transcriptional regulator YbjK
MTSASQVRTTGRRRNPRGEGSRLREQLVSAASEMIADAGDGAAMPAS